MNDREFLLMLHMQEQAIETELLLVGPTSRNISVGNDTRVRYCKVIMEDTKSLDFVRQQIADLEKNSENCEFFQTA